MSTLFINGEVAEDRWVRIDGEQPIPDGEDVIVTLPVFEENRIISPLVVGRPIFGLSKNPGDILMAKLSTPGT